MISARVASLAAAVTVLAVGGCGGNDGTTTQPATNVASAPPSTSTTPTSSVTKRGAPLGPPRKRGHAPAKGRKSPKPKPPAVPPGVEAALHDYVAALDAHDGAKLCALFVPGALDALRLPVGSSCDGLSESLGYNPPHGLPQWRDARFVAIKNVVSEAGGVRVTATIVDRYAGNPQPSIEDDVIFLKRSGKRWLIQQPSVTVYRAIGTPNPPPSVLAAPG